MKKFTLKDFIGYNNPCFSCGSSISLRLGISAPGTDTGFLRPTVLQSHTEIDLANRYNSLLRIAIDHKTNKFVASNTEHLIKYLEERRIFWESNCTKCMTMIESENLEFDLSKGFIKPVGLRSESLIMNDNGDMYHIISSHSKRRSMVIVDNMRKPSSAFRIETPILPLYRFRSKVRLIEKLKTYVLFS